jgi:hypothetical protein
MALPPLRVTTGSMYRFAPALNSGKDHWMPRLYVNCACAARKHVTEALMQFWRTGILACFIAMTCIPSTASAATSSSIPNTWADGISLQEFIAFIAENNSALQVARNGNTIAREVITEERGIFQPILSITSRANRSLQPLSVDDQCCNAYRPYPTAINARVSLSHFAQSHQYYRLPRRRA